MVGYAPTPQDFQSRASTKLASLPFEHKNTQFFLKK